MAIDQVRLLNKDRLKESAVLSATSREFKFGGKSEPLSREKRQRIKNSSLLGTYSSIRTA